MLTLELRKPCADTPPQIRIFNASDDQSAPSLVVPATETGRVRNRTENRSNTPREKLIRPKRAAKVSEKCRLCGTVCPEMSPIFGVPGLQRKLAEKIATILPLRVDPTDRLPLNVCRACCGRLEDAHDFYLTCMHADSSLQSQLAAEDAESLQRRQYIPLILADHSYSEQSGPAVIDEKLVSVSKFLPESQQVAQAIEAVRAGRGKNVPLLSKTHTVEEAMELLSAPLTVIRPLFHCSKCNCDLANSFELIEHELQKFSCKRCPQRFCTAKLQRKHRFEHQKLDFCAAKTQEQFENSTCDGETLKFNLNNFVHFGEAKHSCHLCEAHFRSLTQLSWHLDLHFGARYECDACKQHFQHKMHLARHIRLKHLAPYHFKCNLCQLQFYSKSEVLQHLETHGNNDLLRSEPKFELVTPYKCEICGECKSSPVVLRKHVEKHTNNYGDDQSSSVKCHLCGKEFKSEKNLRTHMTMGHLQGAHVFVKTRPPCAKKHACSQCPRRFRRMRELADHLNFSHSNVLRYSCNFCQKKFGTDAGRKIHIYGRRQLPAYPCGMCDAKFNSKCERDSHQLQQHEQRFPCSMCGACFGRKSQLHGHTGRKHAHQTPKNFCCEVCGKGFNLGAKLKKHYLSHVTQ